MPVHPVVPPTRFKCFPTPPLICVLRGSAGWRLFGVSGLLLILLGGLHTHLPSLSYALHG